MDQAVAKISIIIPTLNEEKVLKNTIANIPEDPYTELIVVDGGSTDRTEGIARLYTEKFYRVATPSRSEQMNLGAKYSEGDLLIFLHADSLLPKDGLNKIRDAISSGAIGGAFNLSIKSERSSLRLIAFIANIRSRLTRIPYGDQGIFVKKAVFKEIGGFKSIPLMEDIDFSLRLKKRGKVVFIKDKIVTSDRRWEREGVIWGTLRNWLLTVLFYLGVSPVRLVRWYRRDTR